MARVTNSSWDTASDMCIDVLYKVNLYVKLVDYNGFPEPVGDSGSG